MSSANAFPIHAHHRLVHLDLKGAPPKLSYLKQLLPLLKDNGATGLLVEYEDTFPYCAPLECLRRTGYLDTQSCNTSNDTVCDQTQDTENVHLEPDSNGDSSVNSQMDSTSKQSQGLLYYTRAEVTELQAEATKNDLSIIPLVQTFGHLEFILKHTKFRHLRESRAYANSLCPQRTESFYLVQQCVMQIVEAHPNIQYIHLGMDEVLMSQCDQCRIQQSHGHIFLEWAVKICRWIRLAYPHIRSIIWDDMLRQIPVQQIKESGLPALTDIMLWSYDGCLVNIPPGYVEQISLVFTGNAATDSSDCCPKNCTREDKENDINKSPASSEDWSANTKQESYINKSSELNSNPSSVSDVAVSPRPNISHVAESNANICLESSLNNSSQSNAGTTSSSDDVIVKDGSAGTGGVWFASAFKGATGSTQIVVPVQYHVSNHMAWLSLISYYGHLITNSYRGFVLTGWQRYDHCSVLCELLPAAVPSLVLCLQVLLQGGFTVDLHQRVSYALGFKDLLDLYPLPKPMRIEHDMTFPGHKLFSCLHMWLDLYHSYLSFIDSERIKGWYHRHCRRRMFLSAGIMQIVRPTIQRYHQTAEDLKARLTREMNEIFDVHTVSEFMDCNVEPTVHKLRLECIENLLLQQHDTTLCRDHRRLVVGEDADCSTPPVPECYWSKEELNNMTECLCSNLKESLS